MTRKSVARCCVFPEVHTPTHAYAGSLVYLNVYDLSPMNISYLYWAGVGIFHSGVEVHGVEYAFGSIKYPASGIFKVEPRQCPSYKFKKSIYIGTTFLDPFQVKELMKLKSESYYGHTYHLLTKNCNHFSDDVCSKLTGSSIPKWVNRLARLGSFCICIIPEILEPSRVCHSEKDNDPDNEKVSLRMSNASSRICPLVHHCTLETGVSSSFASPERMSMLKSEFVAALDKNAKLKKQIRELTEKLRLAEQGLDSAVIEIIKNQARKSDHLQ